MARKSLDIPTKEGDFFVIKREMLKTLCIKP